MSAAIPLPLQHHEVARALDIARELARAGVPIFVAPAAPGTPIGFRLPGGWERVLPDPSVVDTWRPGDALCAVGGADCDFLDVDPRNGGHVSAEQLSEVGYWPESYGTALTPSGGSHHVIAPLGVGKCTPIQGIDLQGGRPDGTGRGFVFIAPTVRASKIDGVQRPYRWSIEPDLGRLVLCRGEQSGAELAKLAPARHRASGGRPDGPPQDGFFERTFTHEQALTYCRPAMDRLSCAQPGERNNRLNDAAKVLSHFIPEFWSEDEASAWLIEALMTVDPDYDEIKAQSTFRSAFGSAFGDWTATKVEETSSNPLDSSVDAPEFWAQRPVLKHLHDFALSRRVSPWALLGAVLVRVVAATPPRVQLPPLVGGNASLNMFLALVGRSGDGKGAATTAARAALDLGGTTFAEHTVGSGQGIAHAFAHRTKDGVERHAESALLVVEEVDHLAGHASQNGSTTLAELKRLYTGEKLGHLYVDLTKRIEIPEHSYRAGLIVGVQPTHAGVIFDDSDGGTPQRFVWLPVAYPHPDERPPEPDPWRWEAPAWPGTDPGLRVDLNPFMTGPAVDSPFDANPATAVHLMSVPDAVVTAVDAAHLARSRGQGDPLDGHRLLCQEKTAAAFAILDGRCDVTEQDWELAAQLMSVSDRTRADVVDALSTASKQANAAKGAAEASRAVTVDEAKEAAGTKRAVRAARGALVRLGGSASAAELRKNINSKYRASLVDALELMLQTGDITEEKIDYQGQEGVRYRLCQR